MIIKYGVTATEFEVLDSESAPNWLRAKKDSKSEKDKQDSNTNEPGAEAEEEEE
jgi:hypothetical protein